MNDPEHLRAQVIKMRALAVRIRDDQPAYANVLIELAQELQAKATTIEDAARRPPVDDVPQPLAQLQEQIQPKADEE